LLVAETLQSFQTLGGSVISNVFNLTQAVSFVSKQHEHPNFWQLMAIVHRENDRAQPATQGRFYQSTVGLL